MTLAVVANNYHTPESIIEKSGLDVKNNANEAEEEDSSSSDEDSDEDSDEEKEKEKDAIPSLLLEGEKKEQNRRNTLVRMDIDVTDEDEDEIDKTPGSDNNETATISTTKDIPLTEKALQQKKKKSKMNKKAHRFKRTALPFILYTASPYMVEIIAYGNLNAFAFVCFKDDVHRAVRLYDLFDHDNYLVALADHSAKSPAGNI